MVGKKENELCILLAYTGCTEGNTKGLSDNIYFTPAHVWSSSNYKNVKRKAVPL
jgi:hypothetical protein